MGEIKRSTEPKKPKNNLIRVVATLWCLGFGYLSTPTHPVGTIMYVELALAWISLIGMVIVIWRL